MECRVYSDRLIEVLVFFESRSMTYNFRSFSDMSSIFSGQGAIQQAATSVVNERANILVLSMDKFSDTTVEAFAGKTYWVHHDSTDGMASLVSIRDDYSVTSGTSYKNYVFYVLPISYF